MPWIGRRLAQPETEPPGDGAAAGRGAAIAGPPGKKQGSRNRIAAKAVEVLCKYGGSAIVLVAFLAIPAWLFWDNVANAGSAVTLPSPVPLGAPTANYFGTPVQTYSAGRGAEFCVVFEFLGMNQATSEVNLGILIGITSKGLTMLNGQHPAQKDGQLVFASESGLSTFAVKFPLSPLTARAVTCASMMNPPTLEQEAPFRIIQPVFVLGTPRSFPDDWYELNDKITVKVAGSRRSSSLILTSRDEGFRLTANRFITADKSPWASRISFIVRRQRVVVVYTYFIAMMPAALLIGIFYLIYRQKRSAPGGKLPARSLPGATDVAFGVAATMVAILPLRAVLVPGSLPAPTRLDVFFGLQIALLVALSILWIKKTAAWAPAAESSPGGQPPSGDSAEAAALRH
jgi:hypothetical protein